MKCKCFTPQEYFEAVQKDMKKHPAETNGTDLKFTESDLGYAMKHLKGWMADQYVKTVSFLSCQKLFSCGFSCGFNVKLMGQQAHASAFLRLRLETSISRYKLVDQALTRSSLVLGGSGNWTVHFNPSCAWISLKLFYLLSEHYTPLPHACNQFSENLLPDVHILGAPLLTPLA